MGSKYTFPHACLQHRTSRSPTDHEASKFHPPRCIYFTSPPPALNTSPSIQLHPASSNINNSCCCCCLSIFQLVSDSLLTPTDMIARISRLFRNPPPEVDCVHLSIFKPVVQLYRLLLPYSDRLSLVTGYRHARAPYPLLSSFSITRRQRFICW